MRLILASKRKNKTKAVMSITSALSNKNRSESKQIDNLFTTTILLGYFNSEDSKVKRKSYNG